MTFLYKIIFLAAVALIAITNDSCNSKNHIDKYKVNPDSLKTLPDNFYAYRRGNIYLEDVKTANYRIWFELDDKGNIKDILRMEDVRSANSKSATVMKTYSIDTFLNKQYAQKFIDLSRQYKFGHIYIDRKNKISFSCNEDVSEQYVRTLNGSLKQVYASRKDFTLLPNGWFEYTGQQTSAETYLLSSRLTGH